MLLRVSRGVCELPMIRILQIPLDCARDDIWWFSYLVIRIWNLFGIWCLEFGY